MRWKTSVPRTLTTRPGDLTNLSCLCRGRRIVAFCWLACRDYIDRPWVGSSLGNSHRRDLHQRLVVTGQPECGTLGGSLCTSSGHSSSTLAYRRRFLGGPLSQRGTC